METRSHFTHPAFRPLLELPGLVSVEMLAGDPELVDSDHCEWRDVDGLIRCVPKAGDSCDYCARVLVRQTRADGSVSVRLHCVCFS